MNHKIASQLTKRVHIAPLVTFRILFGLMMAGSMVRFWAKGWIYDLYVAPKHFFTYYGFDWVKPLNELGMYAVFFLLFVSALGIAFGAFYRWSSILFFTLFTYVELIDKSTYLNHYYFISVVALLLVFLPAHKYFSVDVYRKPTIYQEKIPFWFIGAIQLQLGIVYFYAGIAKLNYDWLVRAMPLKLWLPAHSSVPIVGGLFQKSWVAFGFSWFGAAYDLFIPFLLVIKRFRLFAYSMVIAFHVVTGWLFQIGMFPYIMILATLIFFSEEFHIKLLNKVQSLFALPMFDVSLERKSSNPKYTAVFAGVLTVHFLFQLAFPFRYLAYEGNRFWHEQGYRFGWRVMLSEKAGTAFFTAVLPQSQQQMAINNSDYLTPNQEKMMSTQPDMILQYAQIIEEDLSEQGYADVEVKVESYATLNGSGSRPFIDPEVDLTQLTDSWKPKTWVLPFNR
ncbi:MAG: HTTM domain-containing protein [Salibacteraceae bacterium]